MIRAYRALAVTLYFLGDFQTAHQYAMRGVQTWRSGGIQSPVEEISTPEVICLGYAAISACHFGEITFYRAAMAESISLAKELNDMHVLAWHCILPGISATLSAILLKRNAAVGFDRTVNASEFSALASWRRGFSRLGAERFRGHS